MNDQSSTSRRVGLFVTCLVDLYRPSVGFAAVKLLEQAGCRVEIPLTQTCCGQPGYNNGDYKTTAAIARQVIEAFEPYDYIVAPSGSCVGMLKYYPRLFADEPDWCARAERLAQHSHELLSFLADVCGATNTDTAYHGTTTYHDSCSGLRQLGIREQPRRLLQSVSGLKLTEMKDSDVCCGFGGTFCVKYPDISGRMVADKANHITDTGADTVLGGDLGCLLNIAGRLKHTGHNINVYHAAEVLAGMTDQPGIGDGEAD